MIQKMGIMGNIFRYLETEKPLTMPLNSQRYLPVSDAVKLYVSSCPLS